MIVKIIDKLYLKDIYQIECEIFDSHYTYDQLVEMFNNNLYTFYGYYVTDKLVAYLIILKINPAIEIIKIGTKQQFQKQGIGSKLINFIKSQFDEIYLEVSEKNTNAIQFYLKHNFTQINVRKKYYCDNSNALILEYKK